MRRIVVVATAVAVLVAAASAIAATGGLNSYTAKLSFSPNKAGSGKAPSSLAYTEKYVANGTGGNGRYLADGSLSIVGSLSS